MAIDKDIIKQAVAAYTYPDNDFSLEEISSQFDISKTTHFRHVHGFEDKIHPHESQQILTTEQELILEAHIIFLFQNLTPPKVPAVRQLAAKILNTPT